MADINEFLSSDRTNFRQKGLNESVLPKYPVELFKEWLVQAIGKENPESYAFALLTNDKNGFPQGRMVYLRALEDDGSLVFFTNYSGAKARQIEENNKVGALFFWPLNERQVRVSGKVTKVSEEVSDAYFASRPRTSQIGAWASAQSSELKSRQELEIKVAEMTERFSSYDEIPRPDFWGGYAITPVAYEFWEGRDSRLHDRIQYVKQVDEWTIQRLSP